MKRNFGAVLPAQKKRRWIRPVRLDADELVRDVDLLVQDTWRSAFEYPPEPKPVRTNMAIISTSIGHLIGMALGMLGIGAAFDGSVTPSIPPIPMHPDRKAMHLDLRAVGHDLSVVIRHYAEQHPL